MRLALRQLVLVVGKLEVGAARVQVGLVRVRVIRAALQPAAGGRGGSP